MPAGDDVDVEAQSVPDDASLELQWEQAVVGPLQHPRRHRRPGGQRPRLLERGVGLTGFADVESSVPNRVGNVVEEVFDWVEVVAAQTDPLSVRTGRRVLSGGFPELSGALPGRGRIGLTRITRSIGRAAASIPAV